MSRPIKRGLGYFPVDVDFLSDRKIRRLLQSQGCEGIAIYMAILCEAYETTGYYVRYTDDLCFDIGFILNIDEAAVRRAIERCVEARLFDRGLLEREGILTSRGIQRRFSWVSKRRSARIRPEWALADDREEVIDAVTPVTVAETRVNAAITDITATETSPKVKVKENNKEKREEKEETNRADGPQTETEHADIQESTLPDPGEAGRRAELLRMAAIATGDR